MAVLGFEVLSPFFKKIFETAVKKQEKRTIVAMYMILLNSNSLRGVNNI
jgi:hypothetical protein